MRVGDVVDVCPVSAVLVGAKLHAFAPSIEGRLEGMHEIAVARPGMHQRETYYDIVLYSPEYNRRTQSHRIQPVFAIRVQENLVSLRLGSVVHVDSSRRDRLSLVDILQIVTVEYDPRGAGEHKLLYAANYGGSNRQMRPSDVDLVVYSIGLSTLGHDYGYFKVYR